jgi:hypothetical protein
MNPMNNGYPVSDVKNQAPEISQEKYSLHIAQKAIVNEEKLWLYRVRRSTVIDSEKSVEIIDNDEKSHNMSLSGAVVAEPKLLPKNFLLMHELQALLDSSANALKSDPSEQNSQKVLLNVLTQTLQLAPMRAEATGAETQAVMLDVMERSAQFVEANISVPQFNSKEATGVRTLVFNVYHRLAKVLGRNTHEAVKADLRALLAAASERIKYTNRPGRKPKAIIAQLDSNEPNGPDQHIERVIQPVLDEDMKRYACEMSTYYIPEVPSLRSFYTVLGKWRAGHTPVKQK